MPPFSLQRTFSVNKVPEITFTFWFLKVLTTAMGESTSDYFVHRLPPEVAVLGGGVAFAVALLWQLRSTVFRTARYWFAVAMVSVFGTMCADVVHVGFGVAYLVSSVAFGVALAAVFITWHRVERTLSIHSIRSTRPELFYWAAITTTFALGTATGDMTASTLHLGYFSSGVLFGALICLPAVGYRYLHLNAIGTFWTGYILTRPLGASFADWIGVSRARGGLDWGPGTIALLLSGAIAVVVAALVWRERQRAAVAIIATGD